ncbi:tRNA epoxyqueuosine(34) reductase QueG [Brucella pseudogrignonensis]|uniref:tRNA epoxyqueuosine(34) reductase QueG n=1 Tax=Brucella pseudogrignonensis TaxID=419475 RepID=UPI000DE22DE3|nr:tRNA epoxyqueuosine(34) reductase QueG [Brucella pseudogrignonensis]KAB2692273.1 tRNA epoxyqueuosine(34) reductase QueG [Brucella pseudogrignonensis]
MATSTSDTSQASDKALKLKRFLIEEAKAVGFDAVAFTGPDSIPQAPQRLRQYIADGHHADMVWMEETEERRANPSVLWPEVRSIMVLAMNYGPDSNPLSILEHKDRAAISVYAQNRDYHDIIKGKLKHIASRFAARAGQDVKVFVDTAPVMEKPLAQAAGLGWQGKHTNLVSRELGSWLFLGSIFTTAEIPPDEPDRDHCGSCRACLDACPTKAFPSPYRIDAGRCISYLTIENKGPIPHEFRKAMGNRIYGCDDCLSVCPWNKFAQATSEMKLKARDDLKAPKLADFLALDDPAFRTLFSGSPVKRIGRDRFLRNVLIATGNSEDQTLVPQVESLLEDPAPVVRGAAVWALKQLVSTDRFKISQKRLASREEDATVRAEWSLEHQSD